MTKASDIALIAFSPHPDDAEIFCGGLLLSSKARGYSTGIIDLTRGEMSSRGDLETRSKESAAAGKLLGLALRENLELPDGGIGIESAVSLAEQARRIVRAIRRHRPEVILAPYWQDRHPDHPAASGLLSRSVFSAGLIKYDCGEPGLAPYTPRQVLYYQLRAEFNPSFIVDISAVAADKYKAIDCYQSQVIPPAPGSASTETLIGSELNRSSLRARDQYYGALIGTAAGEPYKTREAVALADPIGHIRGEQKKLVYFFQPE